MADAGQDKRTGFVRIRVNVAERIQLSERVPTGAPLSDWLRRLALGQEIPKANRRNHVDQQFIRQLAGLGNNLNQIARACNYTAVANEQILLLEVLLQLRNIERALFEIRQAAQL